MNQRAFNKYHLIQPRAASVFYRPVTFLTDLCVPVTSNGRLPRADISVTSQHFEGRRLSSSVNSQETEALTEQNTTRFSMQRHNIAEIHSSAQRITASLDTIIFFLAS